MKAVSFSINSLFVLSILGTLQRISAEATSEITNYEYNNDGSGTYNFRFETSDGTSRNENGFVKNIGDPKNEILVVRGSYSYLSPDGVFYTVNYIADENGFRPEITQNNLTLQPAHEIGEAPVGLSADVLGSLLGLENTKSSNINIPVSLAE